MDFFLYQSEICSGIQKSYLENRTSIIKSFKIKNPIFLTQISGFPCTVTYTDPLLFHLQKYVTNPLRQVRIFSKGRDHAFGAAPAVSDSRRAHPGYCVNPNAAGAKMISFKSFTFTRGTRSPKGNCQILLVLELEGVKDSRNRSKIEEEKTLSGKKSR